MEREKIRKYFVESLNEMIESKMSLKDIYERFELYLNNEDYKYDLLYEENPKIYVEVLKEFVINK